MFLVVNHLHRRHHLTHVLGGTRHVSSRTQGDLTINRGDFTIGISRHGGQPRVGLFADARIKRQLAQNTELQYSGSATAPEDYSRASEPVLLDGGDREETVVTQTAYPTYRGALVVCQGGDRADVKLAVTAAVSALTGLPSDRVTVAKCQ